MYMYMMYISLIVGNDNKPDYSSQWLSKCLIYPDSATTTVRPSTGACGGWAWAFWFRFLPGTNFTKRLCAHNSNLKKIHEIYVQSVTVLHHPRYLLCGIGPVPLFCQLMHVWPRIFIWNQILRHSPIKCLKVLHISKLYDNFCIYWCELYMPLVHWRWKCPVTKFGQQKPWSSD